MQLSPRWYAVVWSGVFLVHATYVAGYGFESRWYLTAVQDGAKLAYLMRLHSLRDGFIAGIDLAVVATSSAIAMWHMTALVRMTFASFRARSLVFVGSHSRRTRTTSSLGNRQQRSRLDYLLRPLRVLWALFFDFDGAYFELATDLRESIEIATQINVTYRLSRFVEQQQVCHFATLALVLNCWSTPVLRSIWRQCPEKSRFARLLVGVALAVVFTIGLPFMVFQIYYGMLVGSRDSLFRPKSVVAIGHLLQQILTIQWIDVVSTRFAAFMAILGIETIKRRARRSAMPKISRPVVHTGPTILEPMRGPGARKELSLHRLDAVAIMHCPALTVPRELRSCRQMMQLEIFNATLADWGTDAALTERDHPRFTFLSMIHVRNMTTLPSGVLADGFPAIAVDIGDTDLATLPSGLATKWTRHLEYLVLERCNLTSLSSVFWELRYRRLSLAGNRISSLPAALFNDRSIRSLSLSGNPISRLVESDAVHAWSVRSMELLETNISTLPAWVIAAAAAPGTARPFVEAAGSPLCADLRETPSFLSCTYSRHEDPTTWIPFTRLHAPTPTPK
ncbi:hypothetical protein P43SY_006916 [Pythium insidiosum]|uniref:Uncharacterized protein n=1 Tax=Pythium insidiosum TaxID=114742 RepID=A0AAD5LLN1_PYTIN|nr:hypothetical protein P43SY_006916 [Pythium insidiosum]